MISAIVFGNEEIAGAAALVLNGHYGYQRVGVEVHPKNIDDPASGTTAMENPRWAVGDMQFSMEDARLATNKPTDQEALDSLGGMYNGILGEFAPPQTFPPGEPTPQSWGF